MADASDGGSFDGSAPDDGASDGGSFDGGASDGVHVERSVASSAPVASGALETSEGGSAHDGQVIDLRDPIGDAAYYSPESVHVASAGLRAGTGAASAPGSPGERRYPDWDEPAGAAGDEFDVADPHENDVPDDLGEHGDESGGASDEGAADEHADPELDDEGITRRRRGWRWWLVVSAAMLLLGAVAAAFAVFGPFLRIKDVQISGADGAVQEQIQRAAGVRMDAPLVTAPISEIADRVASLPAVREVTVQRTYPDSISIAVQLRTPVAQVLVDDKSVLVDAAGVPFSERVKPAKRLPAIKAPTPELMADAAEVASTLPPSIRRRTETITAPASNQVELTLRKGQRVLWGDSSAPELKGQVLLAMLKPVVVKNVTDAKSADPPVFTWFDVSTPTAPTAAVVMPESRMNRCAPPASGSTSTNVPLGCTAADVAAAAEAAGIPLDEVLGQGADSSATGESTGGTAGDEGAGGPTTGGAGTGGAAQSEIPSDTAN